LVPFVPFGALYFVLPFRYLVYFGLVLSIEILAFHLHLFIHVLLVCSPSFGAYTGGGHSPTTFTSYFPFSPCLSVPTLTLREI